MSAFRRDVWPYLLAASLWVTINPTLAPRCQPHDQTHRARGAEAEIKTWSGSNGEKKRQIKDIRVCTALQLSERSKRKRGALFLFTADVLLKRRSPI